ncbi:MAG: hypothetical protein ACT4TC_20455 [Myxococcaceae bacterium]
MVKRVSKKTGEAGGDPVAVILERMEEQNRLTYEALMGFRREVADQFAQLEQRLTLRIEALEFAVRQNSEDIRKNSEDIQKLFGLVSDLSAELKTKPSMEELRKLEVRVAKLEQRLGL